MGNIDFDLDLHWAIGGARDTGSRAAADPTALLLPIQSVRSGPYRAADRACRAASGRAIASTAVGK
jgi:hypothetical protein